MAQERVPAPRPAHHRRKHIAQEFDSRVDREWKRYSGEARRVLQRELMERFLRRHLSRSGRDILELGPGPGRFTGTLLSRRPRRLFEVDISRGSLTSSRKRFRGRSYDRRMHWVQAAGEHLPLSDTTVDETVIFGNIVSFAVDDGPLMIREVARVTRPDGLLLVEFPQVVGALQDALLAWSRKRALRKVLRDPEYYYLNQILRTGYQPYAPERFCQWEFKFYTFPEARNLLAQAGFRTVDVMSVGPLSAYQEGIARAAKQERRTWEELLRLEEITGRHEGALECGHGFLLAALRDPTVTQ